MSITKNKYVILAHIIEKVIWIKRFINKLKINIIEIINLNSNNKMSIALIKNVKNQ